jgi:glycosyltransferase involved in cell wall biosynthesis
VIVSNLAPYAPSVEHLYRGTERLRLQALRRLTDLTLERASKIFLLSEQAFDLLGEERLRGRGELLPMAPPPVGIEPAQGHDEMARTAGPYYLVVGDLLRYKGVETAIQALGMLRCQQRPALLVVGRAIDRPYVRRLRAIASAAGVENNVRFIGSLEHHDVLRLMHASLAVVVPSSFENPSRIPVEAMATGAAVIASDIPEFRATCGEASLYFRPGAAGELARQMREIIERPAVAQDARSRSRKRLRRLHVGSATERIATTIQELAG